MLPYKRSDYLEMIGYTNSNFFGCMDTRNSTFGYVYLLARGAMSWKSAYQSTIVPSTTKAEFVACFQATVQANWLWNFISRLGVIDSMAKPLRIYCDNFAAILFSRNDKYSKGAKHMKLKYFVIKEEVHKHSVNRTYQNQSYDC